jgi:integrase
VSTLEQARSALTVYFSQTSRGDEAPALELPLSVRRRRRPLPTFLVCDDEDAVQSITALRGAYQVAAWLIYDAGLSAAEAAHVRVSEVDIDARSLLINQAQPPAPNLGAAAVRTLQHHLFHLRQRALEISPELTDAEWRAQYLLPTRSHLPVATPPALWAPVTDEAIQRNIGRAFRRAGMPTDRPCTVLRNSCIWRLMRAGLEPRQIAAAIGATSTTHILRARRAKPLSRT